MRTILLCVNIYMYKDLELMRMKYILYVLVFLSFLSSNAKQTSAITFQGGGRFGDQLITYCKAKWLSYKYEIPFMCPDFLLKDTLQLAKKEKQLTKAKRKKFQREVIVKDEKDIDPTASSTLFVVDYYVTMQDFSTHQAFKKLISDHPLFLKELRLQIAPRKPLKKLILPKDTLTVALHVRRGSAKDKPLLHNKNEKDHIAYADKRWPCKFPPDEYYIEQIKRLDILTGHQPMYVHIFTDATDPESIARTYQESLNLPHISFGCQQGSQRDNSIINDLFAMMQFDCLIRSSSNYSSIAYLLGDHMHMIAASHGTWHKNFLTIDQILISFRQDDGTISYEYVNRG